MRLFPITFILLAIIFVPSPSAAQEQGQIYTLGGDDCDNSPTSFCDPAIALASLESGDTLVIQPGIYQERLVIDGLHGTAEAPITIRGTSTVDVVFDGGCVEFPCILDEATWGADWGLAGFIQVDDSSHLIISDLTAQNIVAEGIHVANSSHITIDTTNVNGTGNAGIIVLYSDNISVRDNTITFAQQGYFLTRGGEPQIPAHETLSIVGTKTFEVSGNTLRYSLKEGIDVKENASDGRVLRNRLTYMCAVGIYINEAFDIDVRENEIRWSGYLDEDISCDQHPVYGPSMAAFIGNGILLATGDLGELSQGQLADVRLVQNIIAHAHGNCIVTWDELRASGDGEGSMSGIQIVNNTLYACGLAGIRLQDIDSAFVANNIIALATEETITGNTIENSTITHNLFWLRETYHTPYGEAVLTGNPRFVDAASGDFRLQDDSPAIDAGMDIGLPWQGAAPDIGAAETGPGGD
ncbi:MAG: hypothetical protein GYB66_14735 [Chloroflexi bacterium]|nr:hypothetical protein [Chloroflexota bacterium]